MVFGMQQTDSRLTGVQSKNGYDLFDRSDLLMQSF